MTDTERIAELLQQQNELLEQRLENGNGSGKRRRRAEEDDDSPRSVREMGRRKDSGGAGGGVWIPVQLSFRSGKTVRLYASADFDGDEEDLYEMVEDMKRRVEVNFYQPKRDFGYQGGRYEGNGYRGGWRGGFGGRGGYGGGYRD